MDEKKYHIEMISLPFQRRCNPFSLIPFVSRFTRKNNDISTLLSTNTATNTATRHTLNSYGETNPKNTRTLLAIRPHPSRLLRGMNRTGRRHAQHTDNPDKMAIIIRSDVKLTTGRIIHFSASIAVRLFQRVCNPSNNSCATWNSSGQKKVVHPVQDDSKMNSIIRYAKQNNIAVAGVRVKIPSSSNNSRGRNRSGSSATKTNSKRVYSVRDDKSQEQQKVKSSDDPVWVAIGVFGPQHLVNKMTKNLPEI